MIEVKAAITVFFTMVLAVVMATSPPHPCQCWPDWEPINENNDWLCKNKNTEKTFVCNVDVPPKCICKEQGKEVELPVGEINCVGSERSFDNRDCGSYEEWNNWFKKYPQFRLYD